MTKDRRYKTINQLISSGHIKTLVELFDTIPKSVVARDLGVSLDRFTKMIHEVERFSIKNLFKLAVLIEIDELLILELVYKQHKTGKKGGRKEK
jgi:hypothetical protein